jgi:hypothetical protein
MHRATLHEYAFDVPEQQPRPCTPTRRDCGRSRKNLSSLEDRSGPPLGTTAKPGCGMRITYILWRSLRGRVASVSQASYRTASAARLGRHVVLYLGGPGGGGWAVVLVPAVMTREMPYTIARESQSGYHVYGWPRLNFQPTLRGFADYSEDGRVACMLGHEGYPAAAEAL